MSTEDEFDDELDSENEDEFTSGGQGKRSKKNGYKISNALKVPRATTYTAQALFEQIHSQDINLEPDYQREVVWHDDKQIGLIDSILRNFYIPPVIFAVNSLDDGTETRTCIDGKQRLTSIYRFMEGLIPHKDPITHEKLWYKSLGKSEGSGRRRTVLPDKYRTMFANKQIVCVEYQDLTDGDERDIFQRVQLGMALTPAEKLQVVNAPRSLFVRELTNKYLKSDSKDDAASGKTSITWDRSRAQDFRCFTQALMIIDKPGGAVNSIGTLSAAKKWLSDRSEVTPAFRKEVIETLRTFEALLDEEYADRGAFTDPPKVAPIEIICIIALISFYKDKLTMEELSDAIRDMRADVRQKHEDVRMNSRIGKTMMTYIHNINPGQGGATFSAGATGKRKRSEEEDVKPSSPKKRTPPASKASTSALPLSKSSSQSVSRPAATSSQTPAASTSGTAFGQDRMASFRAAKDAASGQQSPQLFASQQQSYLSHPSSSQAYATDQFGNQQSQQPMGVPIPMFSSNSLNSALGNHYTGGGVGRTS